MKGLGIVCSAFFVVCSLVGNAQNGKESVAYTPDSVKHVNRSCEYPGHMEGLLEDVKSNLVIPKSAKKDLVHGKVFLRVTIDALGQATNPVVVQGLREDIDGAVVQVVKKLRRFEPATMDGKKVNTSILVPISF
jgi:TonB family protein